MHPTLASIEPQFAQILCSQPTGELRQCTPLVNDALREQATQGEHLLVLAQAGDLGPVRPPRCTPDQSLWVIALPESFTGVLVSLARALPAIANCLTRDWLHCTTFLEWHTPTAGVSAPVCLLDQDGRWTDWGELLTLFLTPSRAVLSAAPCDENFIGGLQGAQAASGPNYNPYRLWTDAELDAAAADAKGDAPKRLTFELGDTLNGLKVVDWHRDEKAYAPVQGLQARTEA